LAKENTALLVYQCPMPSGSVVLYSAPWLVLLWQSGARAGEPVPLLRDAFSTSLDGGYIAMRDSDCPDDAVAQDVHSEAFVTKMKVARSGPKERKIPQVVGAASMEDSAAQSPARSRANKPMPQAKLLARHRRKRRTASMLMGVSNSASASKAKALSNNLAKRTVEDVTRPGGGGIMHWVTDARSHKDTWIKLQIVIISLIVLVCFVGCCLIYFERENNGGNLEKMGFDDTCEFAEPDSVGKELGEPNEKETKMDGEINSKHS